MEVDFLDILIPVGKRIQRIENKHFSQDFNFLAVNVVLDIFFLKKGKDFQEIQVEVFNKPDILEKEGFIVNAKSIMEVLLFFSGPLYLRKHHGGK